MSFLDDNKLPILIGLGMLVLIPALVLTPDLNSMWRGPEKVVEEYWQAEADENYEHQFTLFSRIFKLRMLSKSSYLKYKTKRKERLDHAAPSGQATRVIKNIEALEKKGGLALYRSHIRYGTKSVEFDFRLKIESGKWKIDDIRKVTGMSQISLEPARTSTAQKSSQRGAAGKLQRDSESKQTSTTRYSSEESTASGQVGGPSGSSQGFELQVVDKIPESQKQKSRSSSGPTEFKGGVKSAKSVLKSVLDAGHEAGLLDDSEYQSKTKKLSSLKKR